MLQQKYAENQRVRGVLCEVGDPELDRYLEDERIALFLQNEEFMAELRWNKDFLLTLEKGGALLKYILICSCMIRLKRGEEERKENWGSGE
jgi:hypothetical protein